MGVHVDGGLQEMSTIDAQHLIRVPEDMPDEVAVLAEPLTIAYRAVQRSAIGPGEVAVVMGAGPIGLLISQLLLRAHACRVLIFDLDQSRLELAARLGAQPARDAETVARVTDGEMAAAVFEASGAPPAVRLTTDLVRSTGRIVLVGWSHGPVEVDTVALMRKEAELVGSRNSTGAFPPVLRLLEAGVVDTETMITHRFPFGGAPEALRMLDGGEPALKAIISAP
jgi:threonine dehydrogenase-like Zn-dependent dehydrogenase